MHADVSALGDRPVFAERSNQDVERPSRSGLVCYVVTLVRDIAGVAEEIVGLVRETLAGPGYIYDRIDRDERNVYTFRAQMARHRLTENALCGLGRSKTRKVFYAPIGGGITGTEYRAMPLFDHLRRCGLRKMQERHRVDLKVSVEHVGIDA